MLATPPIFIARAPRDVAAWSALFNLQRLPVLESTAAALEEMRAIEDAVDAHMLAEAVVSDPLMTLKLLAHVAHLRRGREGGEVETVTEALVMLGIPPFFRAFGPQQTPQEWLAGQPEALEGFEAVLARSHRAAPRIRSAGTRGSRGPRPSLRHAAPAPRCRRRTVPSSCRRAP